MRRIVTSVVLAATWVAIVLFVTAVGGGWFASPEHSCPPGGACPSPATKPFHWHHALVGGGMTAVLTACLFVPLYLAMKDEQHRLARRRAWQQL